MLVALVAYGCGDDPMAPEITGDNGGDGGGDPYVDVPEIPVPASPGGSVPKTSAILSKVEPLTGVFNPRVADARGYWLQASYCGNLELFRQDFPNAWSSQVPSSFNPIVAQLRRILFQNSSGERDRIQLERDEDGGQCSLIARRRDIEKFQGAALGKPVYIRRDRHWELKPIEDVGEFLLLDPNTQGEIASRYSQGVTNTETSEFGQSLTAEAGLGIGPLRASVSGTLSQTFSTAVEISETKEREFTKTVWGEPGKQIQFMVWELVEVYTVCDENGDAFEDPNYKITMPPMERRGAALKLQATQFDQ
jgi:hypothetical protein